MAENPYDEAFSRALQKMGALTFDQIEDARAAQAQQAASGAPLPLAEILIQQGLITPVMRANIEKQLQAQQDAGIHQLGQYKLLRKLGQGGMGAVYLAEDTVMGRQVAVKVLPKTATDDSENLTRFKREAMTAGKLNHVNIVSAFAVGEDKGFPYYVMEYCDGETLSDLLKRRGSLSQSQVLHVAVQAARGLGFAHENGIIHRDVKPGNIILTRSGVAKVLDLGLSKDISSAHESFATMTGVAMGTPHYISPEQARGEKQIDGRTDVYSLGATLYHLLTGETPFSGTTAAVIMTQHLHAQLPDPRDINPSLSDGVVHILTRAMAKAPDDRYQDMREFATDLELVIDGQMPSSVELDTARSSIAMRKFLLPQKAGLGSDGNGVLEVSDRNSPLAGSLRLRRTTGPQEAIRGTGRQVPIEGRRTTGVREAIGMRPPSGRGSDEQPTAGFTKQQKILFAAGAGTGLLLILGLALALRSDGDGKESAGGAGQKKAVASIQARPAPSLPAALPSPLPSPAPKLAVPPAAPSPIRAPVSTLREPDRPVNTASGVWTEYYESTSSSVPNFGRLPLLGTKPLPAIDIQTPDLMKSSFGRTANLAVRFDGFIEVPRDGEYGFSLASDDGSVLSIGGRQVINNDGPHGMTEKVGYAALKAGKHAFRIEYAQGGGGCGCVLKWSGPEISKQAIPASAFSHLPGQLRGESVVALATAERPAANSDAQPPIGAALSDATVPPRVAFTGTTNLAVQKTPDNVVGLDGRSPPTTAASVQTTAAPNRPAVWTNLFDGKSLDGWRVVNGGDLSKPGKVSAQDGQMVMEPGQPRTGIIWTKAFPARDYEVEFEGKRVSGNGDFATAVFPIGTDFCAFFIGGWGNAFTGLGEIDEKSVDNNISTTRFKFDNGRWYRMRIRVTAERIEAFVDDQKVADVPVQGHRFSLFVKGSTTLMPLRPFGLSAYLSASAIRNVRVRKLSP